MVDLAAASFCLMIVLAGPARMYLSAAGLAPLIYVPNLLLLTATLWYTVFVPERQGYSARHLLTILIIGYGVAVSLLFVAPIQTAMGLYVLLPFWFGLACGPLLLRPDSLLRRLTLPLFLIAAGGVLVNNWFVYPWEGFGYSVGQLDVDGSRQWYSGGQKRLAGLSRASFDAAAQVQIFGLLLALSARSLTARLLVWGLTFYAVYLTSSKGILLAWLVLTPVVVLRTALPQLPLRLLPATFGLLGLVLPLSTLLYTFDASVEDPFLAAVTYSFYDRLNYMWPEAWHLLTEYGSALLGRGIGGIGAAQVYFEPDWFNAGDNVFMYWFVVFGASALPAFAVLLFRSLSIRPFRDATSLRVYGLLMVTLVYGMMTNIVENALLAVVCGLVVRVLMSSDSSRQFRPAPDVGSTHR